MGDSPRIFDFLEPNLGLPGNFQKQIPSFSAVGLPRKWAEYRLSPLIQRRIVTVEAEKRRRNRRVGHRQERNFSV
jgi:hypothetical protein